MLRDLLKDVLIAAGLCLLVIVTLLFSSLNSPFIYQGF